MSYVYKCTGWEKDATVDHYETGCEVQRRTVASEGIRAISANSMSELISRIGSHFGLDLNDVWVGGIDGGYITFNQMEDVDGNEPTERQLNDWKQGLCTLYLCDYTFFIEKHARPVPLTLEDFEGVKTHD